MNENFLKNVCITGAGNGIGRSIAVLMNLRGFNVACVDRDFNGLEITINKMTNLKCKKIAIKADISDIIKINPIIQNTVKNFGSIDILINNAGVTKSSDLINLDEDDWDWMNNINAKASFFCLQAAAKQMIKQGKQKEPYKIIHVASILSRETFDDVVVYGMSKHAIAALIKGGAKSLVEHGITVNGYGPGVVRTELWEQLDKDLVAIGKFDKPGESMDSIAENMILMKRYSYPEDVVGTASFLASSESDYMTGQILMIDGGMVIQ